MGHFAGGWFLLVFAGIFAYLSLIRLANSNGPRTPESSSGLGFFPQLEGLRGILAVSVFIHHAAITYMFLSTGVWDTPPARLYAEAGAEGVKLFFGITGFLFWRRCLQSSGPLEIRPFFRARLRRLLPAYYAACAALFLVVGWRSDFAFHKPVGDVLSEVMQWLCFGLLRWDFPDINGVGGTNLIVAGVFWSLRWEWIFYAALPAMAYFARGKRTGILLAGLALAATVFRTDPLRLFVTYFGPGMIVAHFWCEIGVRFREFFRTHNTDFWQNMLLGLLAVGLAGGMNDFSGLINTFLFAVVLYLKPMIRILSHISVQTLGRVSYSYYLFHGIFLTAVRDFGTNSGWHYQIPTIYWITMTSLGIGILIFCQCAFPFIEAPFINKPQPKPPVPS